MEHYKFFLEDLVYLLKEKLERSQKDRALDKNSFNDGVNMGIYECLDLIKQQAKAFEISLDEIGLQDYNLENYLYT
jgi:hypothetical protein